MPPLGTNCSGVMTTFFLALGSMAGVVATNQLPFATRNVKPLVAVRGVLLLSLTVKETLLTTTALPVPLTIPVAVSRVNPVGRVPV